MFLTCSKSSHDSPLPCMSDYETQHRRGFVLCSLLCFHAHLPPPTRPCRLSPEKRVAVLPSAMACPPLPPASSSSCSPCPGPLGVFETWLKFHLLRQDPRDLLDQLRCPSSFYCSIFSLIIHLNADVPHPRGLGH